MTALPRWTRAPSSPMLMPVTLYRFYALLLGFAGRSGVNEQGGTWKSECLVVVTRPGFRHCWCFRLGRSRGWRPWRERFESRRGRNSVHRDTWTVMYQFVFLRVDVAGVLFSDVAVYLRWVSGQ